MIRILLLELARIAFVVLAFVVAWGFVARASWLFMGSVPYLNSFSAWFFPAVFATMAAVFVAGIVYGRH